MTRRPRHAAYVAVGVLALAGCGRSPGSSTDSLPTVAPQVAPDDDPTVPPSTTTPIPVAAYRCDTSPALIAESMLIERRQGVAVTNCAGAGSPWTESSDTFVDFAIDPGVDAPGTDGVVRYAARYRTSASTSETRAETLRFDRHPDGSWFLVEQIDIDLSERRDDAESTIDRYFAALTRRDVALAADLLVGAGASVEDRSDLARLRDERLLVTGDASGIASAIGAWCDRGAECRQPDALRFEITPSHSVQAIATYVSGPTSFDVAYSVTADSVIGIPPMLR